ncbi:MAG: orotidine-5'-phosphate decarboxylase [Gemmatimonadales bacterium]|nr:MAG: orotidine-5'-phosphate decarboxylase [Gemmatimonadales bacterium]
MSRVIIALDYPHPTQALELVDRLGDGADFYKVGLELFTRAGAPLVEELRRRGKRVFLDLKFHDIPATVAGAVRSASRLGAEFLTVHAAGGRAMMEAAVEAAGSVADAPVADAADTPAHAPPVRILAVTLLTSLSREEVERTLGRAPVDPTHEVARLADLAVGAGVHGVVSSPLEVESLRRRLGSDPLLVTPGIRLAGGEAHDQARIATPEQAIRAGADYLVIGRAVTGAPDPSRALAEIHRTLEAT